MNEIKETFEKIRVRIQAVMDLIVFYIGFLGPFVNRSSAGPRSFRVAMVVCLCNFLSEFALFQF